MLKIMINPEHGGTDGGAAYDGLVEKSLTLKRQNIAAIILRITTVPPFFPEKAILISALPPDWKFSKRRSQRSCDRCSQCRRR